MTVVVAFLCLDGIVVASDSMMTTSTGDISVSHYIGKKLQVIQDKQIFAVAGDLGLGQRFRTLATKFFFSDERFSDEFDYPIKLARELRAQFDSTGILNDMDLSALLAYEFNKRPTCCIFDGLLQPQMLDEHNFFCAFGSGKLHADPFLRFLVDIFCQNGLPTVTDARLYATWTIQHVIATNPGGVSGPIRVGLLETGDHDQFIVRELSDEEIEEHLQAIESGKRSLRTWRKEHHFAAKTETAQTPKINDE